MKIKGTNLMVSVEHDIKIGNNDAIEATVTHQIHLFETEEEDNIEVEIDFGDIFNIKFLGIPIEKGYKAYRKFQSQMLELGIDVQTLIDEECVGILSNKDIEEVKNKFRKII